MSYIIIIVVIIIIAYYFMNKGKSSSKKQTGNNHSYESNEKSAQSKKRSGYGKWVGGGLGWAFGGPIGGILGFIFGSMFDGMQGGEYAYKPGQATGRTQSGDFSVSLLILAAAVMKADGRVMKSELDYVKRFFNAQFGAEIANRNIGMLREILKQDINVYDVSIQIKQYMEYASRLQLMHFLFGIALADGHFHENEVKMIDRIAGYLGLSSHDFQSIKSMFIKDTTSAYTILEITPDASDDEIKKAYRKMAVKYHPDKVSHLGVDVAKAAKEKFQKLSTAYNQIKKERGIA